MNEYEEKRRFGKRYYKNEKGEWIYLVDTMAEEEYRDKVHESVRTIKEFMFFAVLLAAAFLLYLYKPEVLDAIASNPFVIGATVVLGAIVGILALVVFLVVAWIFMKEAIPAFKRDILGIERDE